MSEEYAGLGDVIHIQIDKYESLELHRTGEMIIHQSKEAKKRLDRLKKELFYTAPKCFLIPIGNGENKRIDLSDEERKQLAEELWPSLYKKTTQASNSQEY